MDGSRKIRWWQPCATCAIKKKAPSSRPGPHEIMPFLPCCTLTFSLLHFLFQVFLEASCAVLPLLVFGPEAESAVVVVVEHGAVLAAASLAVAFVAASAAVAFAAASLADIFAAAPAAVAFAAASLADIFAAAPVAVVFAATAADIVVAASFADAAELQASADIVLVFDVLVPASVGVVEADSPGHPRFFALPNAFHCASSSSSAQGVGQEFVHSATGVRTSCGICSILSNRGLHHNKSLEHSYNKPSPGHNNVNGTSGLPMAATTSHSRKICRHLHQEQRIRLASQAALSLPEVPQIRRVVENQFQY